MVVSRLHLSRRQLIGGLAVAAAVPGWRGAVAAGPEMLGAILARSGLADETGIALIDLVTGAVVEAHQPTFARPPASVAKCLTALWALEGLGPDYRFRTRLRATGPLEAGVVLGDLVLAGSGDPLLDTDALAGLVRVLRARGVTRIAGRLLVEVGALPTIGRTDPGQPVDAGYDPTISGVNLNFNRVHLAWTPGAAGPALAFTAPGTRATAAAPGFRAEIVPQGPLAHRLETVEGGEVEVWDLPAAALRGSASRWLPVRRPGAYAGAALRDLVTQAGLDLPVAEVVEVAGPGVTLAEHSSLPLERILRDLLFYSTNLTAEAVGLRAAQMRGLQPQTLAEAAAAMNAWASQRFDLKATRLVDHSGLSAASRTTAADLVRVLAATTGELAPLLRERPVLDVQRRALRMEGVRVAAKTGTLDFVSGLAGYIEVRGAPQFAFAILTADALRRDLRKGTDRAAPGGARSFAAGARAQEQALLRRWTALHGGTHSPRPRARAPSSG